MSSCLFCALRLVRAKQLYRAKAVPQLECAADSESHSNDHELCVHLVHSVPSQSRSPMEALWLRTVPEGGAHRQDGCRFNRSVLCFARKQVTFTLGQANLTLGTERFEFGAPTEAAINLSFFLFVDRRFKPFSPQPFPNS